MQKTNLLAHVTETPIALDMMCPEVQTMSLWAGSFLFITKLCILPYWICSPLSHLHATLKSFQLHFNLTERCLLSKIQAKVLGNKSISKPVTLAKEIWLAEWQAGLEPEVDLAVNQTSWLKGRLDPMKNGIQHLLGEAGVGIREAKPTNVIFLSPVFFL